MTYTSRRPSDRLIIRQLTHADIPRAMQLKEIASWNQEEGDWDCLLELEQEGCFAGELAGRVVATATALNYGNRIGWIGMVLVDPDFRRQGVATRMMSRAISYLDSLGCQCIKLDATEAGAQVYHRQGFQLEYTVERWIRRSQTSPHRTGRYHSREFQLADLQRIASLDREAFGADRLKLLQWYLRNSAPHLLLEKAGQACGFVLGRPGEFATQVGPLVAERPSEAETLFHGWLSREALETVIADVRAGHENAVRLLEGHGFERSRILRRMYRGSILHSGSPEKVFLLAGFEFG